jgi:Fic family protein
MTRAFVPLPLPPVPALALTADDERLLARANQAIGRLDGLSRLVPDVALLVYGYVRREAVMSSQIEGTQSSLSDLLLFEHEGVPGVPLDDVREVSNYVGALEYGLARLTELPLSRRLLCEIHARLLASGRGERSAPGEVRRVQNWIGGTRPTLATFVPPPPGALDELLAALERFLHDEARAPPVLVKAALAHVQFETIHPFLDGNGRLGRLLITLMLCGDGGLAKPLLYLSLYFKTHRATYYELLQRVRTDGAWAAWVRFFLQGVLEVAESAIDIATRLLARIRDDQALIERSLGRRAGTTLRVHASMTKRPVFRQPELVTQLGLTGPTVAAAVRAMLDLGLVRQLDQRRRDRVFAYGPLVAILTEGT